MSSPVIGLKSVFGNTADPHYFFESQTHAHALKLLSDPGQEILNIRVLVGEPGTGKTVLSLYLLQRLQSTALTAHLFWTQLRCGEFLHYFLHELGVYQPSAVIAEAQKQLTRVLEQNFSREREVVVVIDEAHQLKISTLCALAQLLDCPLGRSKQLRIVLVGLPSLKARLASPSLRQISNRISVTASLRSLTFEESASYIRRRLELSEFRSDQPFTDDAIALIAKIAGGIPREINNICFEALFRVQQRGSSQIDAGMILEGAPEEGWITGQANAQEASSVEARISLESLHPQTLGFDSPRISRTDDLKQFELLPDDSGPLVESTLVPSGNKTLSDSISEWFGYERLAWAGTVGELATSLQQPEAGLMQILNCSSDALRSLGIELTMVDSCRRTTSVCLRALESRKKTKAETTTAAMLNVPEPALYRGREPDTPLIENELSQFQVSHQVVDDASRDCLRTDTPPVSAFASLEALLPTREQILEPPNSRLRRAIVLVLLPIVALGLALITARSPRLSRQISKMLSAHRPAPGASPNPPVPGEQRGTAAKDAKTNLTFNGARAHSQITKPPVDSSSKLLQAARSGDPNAQFELGNAYVTGRGVPEDAVTAYTWLTLAFANGNKQAESLIRELTRTLNPSEIARVRWNLGEMYADGIGVRPDKVTAYMWHLLAELSGEARSRIARARLARNMTADQKSEAQARVSEWLRKHHQPPKKASLPAT